MLVHMGMVEPAAGAHQRARDPEDVFWTRAADQHWA
jgi:hypothetical protein